LLTKIVSMKELGKTAEANDAFAKAKVLGYTGGPFI
jgi:hypothetical protein